MDLMKYLLFLFLLFSTSSFSQRITRYLDATGGVSSWVSLENLVIDSEVKAYEKNYGTGDSVMIKTSQCHKTITKDGLYRGENKGEGGIYITIFDGSDLKEIGPSGFVYNGTDSELEQYLGRSFHLGEAWIALKSNSLKFIEKVNEGEKIYEVYDIEFRGISRKYYISEDTGLLHKIVMFDGRTTSLFEDHRSVNGYVFPFKRSGYINGKIELVEVIRKIQLNQKLDSSIFSLR